MNEKICFVNTPLQDYAKTKRKDYRTMAPLGLGHVATAAKLLGHHVELIDAEDRGLSPEEIANYVEMRDFGIFGINLVSPTVPISKRILELVGKKNGRRIIAGGPHATTAAQHALEELPEIDLVIRGEGEHAIVEFLEGRPYEKILGASYVRDGKIVHSPARPVIQDLDSLPFVDRDLLPEGDKASVMTTRGCPFACVYCSVQVISGKKIRTRSVENIVNELEEIRRRGVNKIHFVDDNFIYSREKSMGLAREIKARNLGLDYRGLARADLVAKMGEDVMAEMHGSGLYQLTFGLESGNPRILQLIKKGITIEDSKRAIEVCKNVGIRTKGYFMIGFPTETEEEIYQTIEFAQKLGLDEPWFVITRAYPGTKLFEMVGSDPAYMEYGQIDEINSISPEEHLRLEKEGVNWEKFVKYGAFNQKPLSEIPTGKLVDLLRDAYRAVYLGEKADKNAEAA
ncbi:radical SAM protein [Candidatus Woesearchaeota archaeon]|nr:radical SAM protein [Candidatus Woesearchaeota archaeon]